MIGVRYFRQPTDTEQDCTICNVHLNRNREVTELACKHIFCTPCIRESFRTVVESCPICQDSIRLDEETAEKAAFYMMRFKWLCAKEEQSCQEEDSEKTYAAMSKALQYADQFDELCLLRGSNEQKAQVEKTVETSKRCHKIFTSALLVLGLICSIKWTSNI